MSDDIQAEEDFWKEQEKLLETLKGKKKPLNREESIK